MALSSTSVCSVVALSSTDLSVLGPDLSVLGPDLSVLGPDLSVLGPDLSVFCTGLSVSSKCSRSVYSGCVT